MVAGDGRGVCGCRCDGELRAILLLAAATRVRNQRGGVLRADASIHRDLSACRAAPDDYQPCNSREALPRIPGPLVSPMTTSITSSIRSISTVARVAAFEKSGRCWGQQSTSLPNRTSVMLGSSCAGPRPRLASSDADVHFAAAPEPAARPGFQISTPIAASDRRSSLPILNDAFARGHRGDNPPFKPHASRPRCFGSFTCRFSRGELMCYKAAGTAR